MLINDRNLCSLREKIIFGQNLFFESLGLTHGTGQQHSGLFLTVDKDYWLKTTFLETQTTFRTVKKNRPLTQITKFCSQQKTKPFKTKFVTKIEQFCSGRPQLPIV